jgi:hypothetical protein
MRMHRMAVRISRKQDEHLSSAALTRAWEKQTMFKVQNNAFLSTDTMWREMHSSPLKGNISLKYFRIILQERWIQDIKIFRQRSLFKITGITNFILGFMQRNVCNLSI